jgi:hypothetical protein
MALGWLDDDIDWEAIDYAGPIHLDPQYQGPPEWVVLRAKHRVATAFTRPDQLHLRKQAYIKDGRGYVLVREVIIYPVKSTIIRELKGE